MKGGYQIIDIRKLNLTLSDSIQSITDAEILEQLKSLCAYIQKGHDFTKPLDNALKCIQIRYRDQKNGQKLEACQWANIVTSNNSLTYKIKTKNLMIEIVFEEKTDEYDNKYYDIKTANYLYTKNEVIEGKLTIDGDLNIAGDTYFEGEVDFSDATVIGLSAGTQLYKHEINFTAEDLGGIVLSLWVISQQAESFSFASLNIYLGQNALVITDDDSVVYRSIVQDSGNLVARTITGTTYTATGIEDFEDNVTEF